MREDAKSSVLCVAILMLVATLTAGSLLFLRQTSPSRATTHPATRATPTPEILPAGDTSGQPATSTTKWDLEAWLRKPASQEPLLSVLPVVEKDKYGVEVSVAF